MRRPRSLDLSCGMTVTHAQSLIPDLTVIDATPDEDEAALMRLALWCIKYSPLVTPNPPDGIFIDVAGSAHLFQGEAALIGDLCRAPRSRRHHGQGGACRYGWLRLGAGALWRGADRLAGPRVGSDRQSAGREPATCRPQPSRP